MFSGITRNTHNRVDLARRRLAAAAAGAVASGLIVTPSGAQTAARLILASAPQSSAEKNDSDDDLTPEQKMARRFPQRVRVGFLVGLPVLDGDDSTIGYIADVVRTGDNKIALIVPYYRWLGWVRNGGFADGWRKPVAVPIEVTAILARQVNALEMSREDFDEAPAFDRLAAKSLRPDEEILIALGRR